MGKGEIARYKQFLSFPQCFQKACFPEASNGVIVWEWVNCYKQWSVSHTSYLNLLQSFTLVWSFAQPLQYMYSFREVEKKNTGKKKTEKKPQNCIGKKNTGKKTQPFLYTYKKGCEFFLYLNSDLNFKKYSIGMCYLNN